MTMTLQDAAEQLRAVGLLVWIRSDERIVGAGSMVPIYDGHNLQGSLPVDEFVIEHHHHRGVWAASITVGQICPFIKVDAELSNVVRAVQEFYTLCHQISVEANDVQLLVSIVQQYLQMVIDICDAQTLRVRFPLSPTFPNTFEQMLASPYITYKAEVFYIRFQEPRWRLEYWRGPDIQLVMPLLHLEEVHSVLVRFFGRPTTIARPPAQSGRPQSTAPTSSAD